MADDIKTEGNEGTPQALYINITATKEGNIKVDSNVLTDQILAFGILENAKFAIIQHNTMLALRKQNEESKLIKTGSIIDFVRKKRF